MSITSSLNTSNHSSTTHYIFPIAIYGRLTIGPECTSGLATI
jgi:hypothetical protein